MSLNHVCLASLSIRDRLATGGSEKLQLSSLIAVFQRVKAQAAAAV